MGLILNGNEPINVLYNGAEVSLYFNGSKIWPIGPDPYNPLNLPPNTIRVRTSDGNAPIKGGSSTTYETATLVAGTTDVYDVYKSGTNLNRLLQGSRNVIEILGANTTGITSMYYMFGDCTSLTSVELFDTSSVTNMSMMFGGCTSLISVPLFDTSNVTDMSYMFQIAYGSSSLTTVPLFNTSNVTNMYDMFYGCTSLTTVPLFNTSNVTNMGGMFYGCTSLTSVPLFVTTNATSMSLMFDDCILLTTIPLFNTSKVTTMNAMFRGCTSLTAVPLYDTTRVTNMSQMFYNCTNVQSGALALYQRASSQATPPSNHSLTFRNCGTNTTTGTAELAQIPSNWK